MSEFDEITIVAAPTFPTGTELGLYGGVIFDSGAPRPQGSPLAQEAVPEDGTVTFTGLEPSTTYVAGAVLEDGWHFISFSTPTEPAYLQQLEEAQAAALSSASSASSAKDLAELAEEAATEAAAAVVAVEKAVAEGKVKGEKGDTGAVGPEGAKGATGAVGPVGPSSGGFILARLATTGALPANALTGTTLEATANGALPTIDEVAAAVGNFVLVKNEGVGTKHGVYEVLSLGAAGTAKWKMARVASMDESSDVVPGMRVAVAEGTTNGGTLLTLQTTGAIVLGTTALVFQWAETWQTPALSGGWENFEGEAPQHVQFRRTAQGHLAFRGAAQTTGSLTKGTALTLFTLPVGFRPLKEENLPVIALVGEFRVPAILLVSSAGLVRYIAPAEGKVQPLWLSGGFYLG